MSSTRRTRQRSFLDDYKIDDQMVLKPDRKLGKSGIYSGFDAEGDPVLVRFWPKLANAPDEDLREIWRHEVRQLHCQTASKADPQYASKVDPSTLCSRTGGEARSGQLAQRVAA